MVRKYLANSDIASKIDVIFHIQNNFKKFTICRPVKYCGFCRPGFGEVFEIIEPIEYSIGILGNKKILGLGVYRIVAQIQSHASHCIILQKFENGNWSAHFCVDGGWPGNQGVVIDWRGIRPVKIE